eukprot:361808-Chlamydomonas_euryale.AAC.1
MSTVAELTSAWDVGWGNVWTLAELTEIWLKKLIWLDVTVMGCDTHRQIWVAQGWMGMDGPRRTGGRASVGRMLSS